MITRTPRETVMLEALERIAQILVTCWDTECRSDSCIAARALATVKAMDEAELRVGTREVVKP